MIHDMEGVDNPHPRMHTDASNGNKGKAQDVGDLMLHNDEVRDKIVIPPMMMNSACA